MRINYDSNQIVQLTKYLHVPAKLMKFKDITGNSLPLTMLSGKINQEIIKLDHCLFDTGNQTNTVVISHRYFKNFNIISGYKNTDYNLTYFRSLAGKTPGQISDEEIEFSFLGVEFRTKIWFYKDSTKRLTQKTAKRLSEITFGMNIFFQFISSIIPINDTDFNFCIKN